MRHRGGGRFIIVDDAEKPISDELFNRAEAQAIIDGKISIEDTLAAR
jgi:hypothetical protein